MQRGFSFLQFMAQDSAQEAIKNENKTMLLDKMIAVRTAVRDAKNQKPNGAPKDVVPVAPSAPVFEALKATAKYIRNANANDVEIIVVAKELTPYAELLEGRMKRVGISCDLLFPNSEVPIGKVLANISSRGTLYAVLVTPQNMEHKSITVNILYGTPAEHRNMPVEAALTLIERDFKEYVARESKASTILPSANSGGPIGIETPALHEGHPDVIHGLLRLLGEDKSLTVLQYDRILKYLTERREMQLKAELGDDPEAMAKLSKPLSSLEPPTPKLSAEEVAMQHKMDEIMNKPSLITIYDSKKEPFKMTPDLLDLLKDQRVERALDSLLSKEIFATLNLKFWHGDRTNFKDFQ